jgi:hypothetical protein
MVFFLRSEGKKSVMRTKGEHHTLDDLASRHQGLSLQYGRWRLPGRGGMLGSSLPAFMKQPPADVVHDCRIRDLSLSPVQVHS